MYQARRVSFSLYTETDNRLESLSSRRTYYTVMGRGSMKHIFYLLEITNLSTNWEL